MKYKVNDIFHSIQGEGAHAGTPAIFVRLAGCNLACAFCDTEFQEYKEYEEREIIHFFEMMKWKTKFVVLTGGEPTIQDLKPLTTMLKAMHYYVAIETNGTRLLNLEPTYYFGDRMIRGDFDWVCVSPKTVSRSMQIKYMDEVKYILRPGDPLPNVDWIKDCDHYWISPMNKNALSLPIGSAACTEIDHKSTMYCYDLVCDNRTKTPWKLNLQMQKFIGVP